MVSKYKGSGWFSESARHSLASKGIRTGKKSLSKIDFSQDFEDFKYVMRWFIHPTKEMREHMTEEQKVARKISLRITVPLAIMVGVSYVAKTFEILGYTSEDLANMTIDFIGVIGQRFVDAVPYVVVGGVAYYGIKGLHKLLVLHYDKKLSKEKLKRKIDESIKTGKPIVITKQELSAEMIPSQTHVISVRDKDKITMQV